MKSRFPEDDFFERVLYALEFFRIRDETKKIILVIRADSLLKE